jgi:hypothetical protein
MSFDIDKDDQQRAQRHFRNLGIDQAEGRRRRIDARREAQDERHAFDQAQLIHLMAFEQEEHPSLTPSQAWDRVCQRHPHLYENYRRSTNDAVKGRGDLSDPPVRGKGKGSTMPVRDDIALDAVLARKVQHLVDQEGMSHEKAFEQVANDNKELIAAWQKRAVPIKRVV